VNAAARSSSGSSGDQHHNADHPESTRLFLTVGLMGGLTTYSSFSYETIRLMEVGAWGQAWGQRPGDDGALSGRVRPGGGGGRLVVGVRV